MLINTLHQKSLIRAAVLSAIAYSSLTHAQTGKTTNAEDDMETIEVRAKGFADSLSKALSIKQSSAGSVDTILAEDIADFPDQNLAEALQRLPGVTITREAGEGREITVRGLNSSFTRVLLNGMQAQSLSAGTGGSRTSRGFDFNVFASELFNQLSVYKTTSATLEEGSLGATVELRTARPFDFSENVFATNLQASYNDASEEVKPRFSGLGSWQNESGTVGFLMSASLSQRIISNRGAETGYWNENGDFGECSACTTDTEFERVNNAYYPWIPRFSDKTHEQDRAGLTASLQFIPSDKTEITLDALYATIDATRYEPYMNTISFAFTGPTGIQQHNVLDYMIDENNTMYAASIDNVDVRSENFVADWDSEFTQFSLDISHDFSDRLRANLLIGQSRSHLNNREVTIIYEHFGNNDDRKIGDYVDNSSTLYYDFSSPYNPSIGYSFDPSEAGNWEISEYRDRVSEAESEIKNARLDFSYLLTDEITLLTGATYKEYTYDIYAENADTQFYVADERDGVIDNVACGINGSLTDADGYVTNNGGQSFFIANPERAEEFINSGCWPYIPRAGDNRTVVEESMSYFVQADFNTEIGGRILRGNAGVRYVETDLTSTGIVNDADEVTINHDYDDTLPAVNLAYELTDDLLLRAAWSKVMSRPSLGTLSPGGSVGIYGPPSVRYGNPFIEPFRADTTDLSVEWYFDEGALLSLAYFSKDIKSFPTSLTERMSWQEVGLPDSLLGPVRDDLIGQQFDVTRTVNGLGGDLDGYEIQFQTPLTFLPGPDWVRQFGVITNVTFVDSEVTYDEETNRVGPLTGQSDKSANFTLYWENEVFSARVSAAYRGDYYTSLSEANRARWRMNGETTFFDFSVSYQYSENMKFTLEGINLTNEPITAFIDPDVMRMTLEQKTGRQFFAGVSYRM